MARERTWIEARAAAHAIKLDRFEDSGDLTAVSTEQLADLIELAAESLAEAHEICSEHARRYPSIVWFFVSTGSGLGGLLLLEPTAGSLIITIGGALGAAKSLYDRGAHLLREQRYLSMYWRASRHESALASELTRRGIRF